MPIEETPVPIMAERMRAEAKELFKGRATDAAGTERATPTTIEVPRWLARLEPQLTAGGASKPADADDAATGAEPGLEERPRHQRKLF